MSLHLYPQRIFWDGRAGCLRNLPFLVELSAYALGVEQKAGVAYAAGVAKYSTGGAITAASAPTAPIVGTGLQIGASQAGVQFGGHIAAFEYLPTKMTDAELQAATT